MFLAFNFLAFLYTCIFLGLFLVSYMVVCQTRLEELFKKGSVWQIRIAQVMLSIIIAYILASGIMSLINNLQ